MILRNKTFFMGLFLILAANVNAQTLKVTLSPDERKVNRNTRNGVSTVVFDSKVKGLVINNGTDDQWMKPSDNMYVYLIDTKEDLIRGYELSQRTFILNSPKSAEYLLEIDEILPNQVLYYTVVLPKQFPITLSAEWLINDHVQKGIRISYGGRYGFFFGGTLGEYRPSGDNIDKVATDCDLSYANRKGYIRTTVFGGFRMGLINVANFSMYAYLGLGYGEHGCQWENRTRLENSRYFYSDYMKGVNTNIGLSIHYGNMVCSLGGEMIFEKTKFMLEWQLGLGIYLNTYNWFKHKIRKL